jgi:hypothetical protein
MRETLVRAVADVGALRAWVDLVTVCEHVNVTFEAAVARAREKMEE